MTLIKSESNPFFKTEMNQLSWTGRSQVMKGGNQNNEFVYTAQKAYE